MAALSLNDMDMILNNMEQDYNYTWAPRQLIFLYCAETSWLEYTHTLVGMHSNSTVTKSQAWKVNYMPIQATRLGWVLYSGFQFLFNMASYNNKEGERVLHIQPYVGY